MAVWGSGFLSIKRSGAAAAGFSGERWRGSEDPELVSAPVAAGVLGSGGAVIRATPSLVQRNMHRLVSPDELDSYRLSLSTPNSHVDSGHQLNLLATEVGMPIGFPPAHYRPPTPFVRGDSERRWAEKLRASGARFHRHARGAA